MGAALVAARDEGRARAAQALERHRDVLAAHAGRVGLRTDQHEVVVHDRLAREAEAFGDELLFGGLVVHEQGVGIAASRHVQRLPGAHGHHAHLGARRLGELRQQVLEQARLFRRGGRCQHDELVLCLRHRGEQRAGEGEKGEASARSHRHRVSPRE
ncbi:hypothetical protein D9M69_614150 [compost metagenome]